MFVWPVEPNVVLPFLTAVSLIELTPGPNMGYLAVIAASEGRGAGFKAVLGITLGLSLYMLAAVAGVAELIAAAPLVYGTLRWAGILYILYLAWEAWRGGAETSPGDAKSDAQAPFWRGLISNVLNPKAALFYVTLLPSFIANDHAAFWIQALILGCLHLIVSVIVHSSIVIGAARVGAVVANAGRTAIVRRAFAGGLALIAVWLAWSTRS